MQKYDFGEEIKTVEVDRNFYVLSKEMFYGLPVS